MYCLHNVSYRTFRSFNSLMWGKALSCRGLLGGGRGGAGDRSGGNISIPPSHRVVIVDIIYWNY